MNNEETTSSTRIDLGQLYLVILLLTVASSFVAGLIATWSVVEDLNTAALRAQAVKVLRNWPLLMPMLALTVTALVGRFVRWHFLLRCLNNRAQIGTSLLAFYSGVPMILTPLGIGEVLSAFVLNRLGGGSVFRGVSAWLTGRIHDVLAVVILITLHHGFGRGVLLLLATLLLAQVGWVTSPLWSAALDRFVKRLRRVPVVRWFAPASALDAALLLSPSCFLPTLIVSVLGVYMVSIVLPLAVYAAGVKPDIQGCSRIFLEGMLYGVSRLSPAGIGLTNRYMWEHLEADLGLPHMVAFQASVLARYVVTGLTIVVGLGVFSFVLNRHRRILSAANRFDALSTRYDQELATYVLDRLLERKTERMRRQLRQLRPDEGAAGLIGVDIGCGTGGYAARMAECSGMLIATDAAEGQVRQASQRRQPNSVYLAAQLPHLPFADESADYAYAINVFHHISSRGTQREAFEEVARILKPGGVFFIHEINTINPLFRFYMGYVFPVLHQLDDGSELWLTPDQVEELCPMPVEAEEYFTFLPEFTPQLWQSSLGFLERWLERSRMRRYSAHYMLMCRKPAGF